MGNRKIEYTLTSEGFTFEPDDNELQGILTAIKNYQLKQEISSEGLYNQKYLEAVALIVNAAWGDIAADRIHISENLEEDETVTIRIITNY